MKEIIKRKLIRIRHYKYHNKPCNFKNGKPCVWETAWDDTYLQTFYYNDNNELIVECCKDYWEAAIFKHDSDIMEYNEVNYDINDIVKLLENHFKPKKDYYIKVVNCETKIG
jgi:hypothetical protein